MRVRQCLWYGCVMRFCVQMCIGYNMAQYAYIALLHMVEEGNAACERTNAQINNARGVKAKSPRVQRVLTGPRSLKRSLSLA